MGLARERESVQPGEHPLVQARGRNQVRVDGDAGTVELVEPVR